MSPSSKAFPVSWEQFHRDARALSWRLSGIGSWDAIVCITRGGLVPAGIIARELDIAEGTVKAHLSMAYKALGVHNRTEAVFAAAKMGLHPPDNDGE